MVKEAPADFTQQAQKRYEELQAELEPRMKELKALENYLKEVGVIAKKTRGRKKKTE
ncbi:hypothetical protein ACFL0Q_05290 [Thermodesulfobacteriota bacterium]